MMVRGYVIGNNGIPPTEHTFVEAKVISKQLKFYASLKAISPKPKQGNHTLII
jgi:hypothetical protein